jgi:hypothetical protein
MTCGFVPAPAVAGTVRGVSASPEAQAVVAERRARLLALRARGVPFEECAAQLGLPGRAAAATDYARALKRADAVVPPVPVHGSWAMYKRHLLAGEDACGACMEAMRERSRTGTCSACGKPVAVRARSLPPDRRRCRDCRRAARGNARVPA